MAFEYLLKGGLARVAVVVVLIAIVLASTWLFAASLHKPPKPQEKPHISWVKNSIGKEPYTATFNEAVVTAAAAPQYSLPLRLDRVEYLGKVRDFVPLSDESLDLLRRNGFVVVGFGEVDSFHQVYKALRRADVPILITTDSVLHLYHVFFDESLARLEEKRFYDELSGMLDALLASMLKWYEEAPKGDVKEATVRNIAFLYVALSLLNTSYEVPDLASALAEQELQLIREHRKMAGSPIFGYVEDYTQYVPRGHYTKSQKLSNYFLAMMWLGRMRFQALSSLQTRQAILLAVAMAEDEGVMKAWEDIYWTTAFFVGKSDDLTVYDYLEAIKEVYGGLPSLEELVDEEKVEAVQELLFQKNNAKIASSPIYPWQRRELVGLRFMGQRFVPDSYIFQELVYSKVEGRLLPKGLDVMAVLGSRRAEQHLAEDKERYGNYEAQLENLKEEFSGLSLENWTQNLYWGWLYTLKPLLAEAPPGSPTFMGTEAWLDEKLNTALGSWAELRHDTILYAKQSYTELAITPPTHAPGYVEPNPQLYTRLAGLCQATINGLRMRGLLDEDMESRLKNFEDFLLRLAEISVKELSGEPLTDDDLSFIRNVASTYEALLMGITERLWRSTIIADVHTDPNTMRVLEVGCGYVELLVAVYASPDGRLVACAGPVFSYYEFPWPVGQRLTDEDWVSLLKAGEAPDRPAWVSSFHA